jgi:hypothetical protein
MLATAQPKSHAAQRTASRRSQAAAPARPNNSSALHLALATAFIVAALAAVRLLVHLFAIDHTEFDGFLFVAALYWGATVIGYASGARATQANRRSAGRR